MGAAVSSATGKWRPVYADLPIVRHCVCDKPTTYRDDEGDLACLRCGRPVKANETDKARTL